MCFNPPFWRGAGWTQGVAALCPGLCSYAPLGLGGEPA